MNKYLFIAPHTDDAELGCGGTMSRMLREGNDIYILVLSLAYKSTLQELEKSATRLGLNLEKVYYANFPVRHLNYYRQSILEKVLRFKKDINPDIIFLPSSNDFHQDHQVAFQEGLRAFKDKQIFGYEYPWNTLKTNLNCFYPIEKEDLDKKVKALKEYKSQNKAFLNDKFIRNWAELNGIKIGIKYAEAFETIRTIR